MTFLQDAIIGAGLGIAARVGVDVVRRRQNRQVLQDAQVTDEFDRRLMAEAERRGLGDQEVSQEFDRRLMEEAERRGFFTEPQISAETMDHIRMIWRAANGNEQLFIRLGATFPDPAVRAILSNPTQVAALIPQLQQEPLGQPVTPGIPSSNVAGFSYDQNTGRLRVAFHGGGTYDFDGVPGPVVQAFADGVRSARTRGENEWGAWWPGKNPSVGATFHQLIRDQFPTQRVA
jgi:hypothetical protein